MATYEVGFAPMGCYIVRVSEDGTHETVRVGIKSYASAVKTAKAMQDSPTGPDDARDE